MIPGEKFPHDLFFDAVLHGPRLTLRPYSESSDLENILALLNHPDVAGASGITNPSCAPEQIRDSRRTRALSPDSGDWTIIMHEDNREVFLGEIGIASWDNDLYIIEIFAALLPEFHRKGYAREAMQVLMKHIFNRTELATIRVKTMETNIAALKLATSLGFRVTGYQWVPADPPRGFIGGIAITLERTV